MTAAEPRLPSGPSDAGSGRRAPTHPEAPRALPEGTVEAVHRAAFEKSPLGICVFDLEGRYREVNDAFCELVRARREDVVGRPVTRFNHPDDNAGSASNLSRLRSGAEDGPLRVRRRLRRTDGRLVHVSAEVVLLRDEAGRPDAILSLVTDVTDHVLAEARLRHLATHDELTGVVNRRGLAERLARLDPATPITVAFVDLDRFKALNDHVGHRGADVVLRTLAERLRALSPEVPARVGGDELVVVLPGHRDEAERRAWGEAVLAEVVREVDVGSTVVEVGASIGVAHGPAVDAEQVVIDADEAMYLAKGSGGRRVVHHDDEVRRRRRRRIEDEDALADALVRDGFHLRYQPVVDLTTGAVRGAEALLRWRAPDGTTREPEAFLAAAVRTRRCLELDTWVLQAVLRDLADHGADRHGAVAVNVMAPTLQSGALATLLARGCDAHGVDPSSLVVECTEHALLDDRSEAARTVTALRDMGVEVALDDFGTGWASLATLRTVPFSVLKVDRRFVAGVDAGGPDAAIVRASIGLARDLDLVVVAEGVETTGQLDALRELGCGLAQGWLLGRPVPLGALAVDGGRPVPTGSRHG